MKPKGTKGIFKELTPKHLLFSQNIITNYFILLKGIENK